MSQTPSRVPQMPSREPEVFQTGQLATTSGVYRSDHPDCSSAQETWIRRGHKFPLCGHCGREAKFHLAEEVGHISEDPDFSM